MGGVLVTLLVNPMSPTVASDPTVPTVGETTVPRESVISSGVALGASGALRLTYWTATKTETVTQAKVRCNTAAGATPTLVRWGVWQEAANGDLTLVAAIANDPALFATVTAFTRSFSASWVKLAGRRYAFGVLVVTGAALPTFSGYPASASGGLDSNELAVAPRLNAAVTGLSDLPSTISAGSLGLNGQGLIYAQVMP